MRQDDHSIKRVLLATDDLAVGGVQRIVVRLAEALTGRGWHVGVAAAAGGTLWDDLPLAVQRHYIPTVIHPFDRVRVIRRLRAIVREQRYEIVHTHQRGISLHARVALGLKRWRVVEHVHNVFLPVSNRLTSFRGPNLIACAPAVLTMLTNDYGRPSSDVTLIRNTVPDAAPSSPITWPMSAGALPHIVSVARLSEQKDPERFVRVVAELNANGPTVTATWVGDGELRDHCEQLVRDLGVTGIDFVGERDDSTPYLRSADLFVMTSRWEGLPLALLEAISLGRGAIVSDVGSCGEAVISGRNGMTYAADASSSEIAQLVRENLSEGTLARWGRASRELYVTEFSPQTMIDAVEGVYLAAKRF